MSGARLRNSEQLTAYLLAELRCARLRARIAVEDIDAIGLALKNGLISPAQAISHIEDADAFRFLGPLPDGLVMEAGE
jgi:hypothetical protein